MTEKKKFIKPELTIEELTAALYLSKEELRKTNAKLIEAEQSRSDLLANISHDLRAPVSALKGTVEYIEEMKVYDEEELKPMLKLMKQKLLTLEQLVNDFFLLTTVENTSIPFHFQRIPMGMFLEDFFYNKEAEEKYNNRHLTLEVPEEFPYEADIDPVRFEQVLDNLFTNAWKYSHEGDSITLSASSRDDWIVIDVKDTGIGIPIDKVEKIFERSYMVDESRTPGAKTGCGLGLSIVRQIVDRLQGKVSCISQEGEGSRFTIKLPKAGSIEI